jgi:hypothetical protein
LACANALRRIGYLLEIAAGLHGARLDEHLHARAREGRQGARQRSRQRTVEALPGLRRLDGDVEGLAGGHRAYLAVRNSVTPSPMRALKALVTVMAVIIVVGVGAVIWGIARQAGKLANPEPPETAQPMTGAPVVTDERAPWQNLALGQPAGTRISSITSAGDLVILQVFTETPGQDERLLVVDPNNGIFLGTITLGARP